MLSLASWEIRVFAASSPCKTGALRFSSLINKTRDVAIASTHSYQASMLGSGILGRTFSAIAM